MKTILKSIKHLSTESQYTNKLLELLRTLSMVFPKLRPSCFMRYCRICWSVLSFLYWIPYYNYQLPCIKLHLYTSMITKILKFRFFQVLLQLQPNQVQFWYHQQYFQYLPGLYRVSKSHYQFEMRLCYGFEN